MNDFERNCIPTTEDFTTAFNGLRRTAKAGKVNVLIPEVTSFLTETAELIATLRAENRSLYTLLHREASSRKFPTPE